MEDRNPQHGRELANQLDLIFGPPSANDAERGAPSVDVHSHDLLSHNLIPAAFGKEREVLEAKSLPSDFEFSLLARQDDLNFTARFVLFDKPSQQEIFDHIVDFVQNYQAEAPNFQVLSDERKVLGYLFEDSKFACYCLSMFSHADTLGLSCDLYDGFAPAINPFWNALRSYLIETQFVQPDNDMIEDDEDDDLDFLDSDTEDDGFILDLSAPAMKYLNLEENPMIIQNWVEDIQNPNFSQDTLLALSFQMQSENNLQVLVDDHAQDLFDSILASLPTMNGETFPAVRSACVFLAELAKSSNVNVTEGNIKVLIDQLAKWTISQDKTTEGLIHSQEVATLLAKCILPKFSELVSGVLHNIQTDVLTKIQEETDFDNVKAYVESYRQTFAPTVQPVH